MEEYLKDNLRKKEILTYTRRNKVSGPSPQAAKNDVPQTNPSKKGIPPPPLATMEVPQPPPPPVHEFLPQPALINEEIRMTIDVPGMMGKMNMSVHMVDMCKIPSVIREVLKELKVQDEARDPLVILNTMYHGRNGEENPLFYLSLSINGLALNKCMLDSRASTNMMSLKFMKQLGLKITLPHGNAYGID
jgi:hypothetical protein